MTPATLDHAGIAARIPHSRTDVPARRHAVVDDRRDRLPRRQPRRSGAPVAPGRWPAGGVCARVRIAGDGAARCAVCAGGRRADAGLSGQRTQRAAARAAARRCARSAACAGAPPGRRRGPGDVRLRAARCSASACWSTVAPPWCLVRSCGRPRSVRHDAGRQTRTGHRRQRRVRQRDRAAPGGTGRHGVAARAFARRCRAGAGADHRRRRRPGAADRVRPRRRRSHARRLRATAARRPGADHRQQRRRARRRRVSRACAPSSGIA